MAEVSGTPEGGTPAAPAGNEPAGNEPAGNEPVVPNEPAGNEGEPAGNEGEPAKGKGEEKPPAGDPDPEPSKEDWTAIRTRIANGDEKLEKRLARYTSVDKMAEALIQAQDKIASGGLKEPLPKDPTPEQLNTYREANGIPLKADEYSLELDDGLVIGEYDEPVVKEFTEVGHGLNLTADQHKGVLNWYFQNQEEQADAMAAQDREMSVEGDVELNKRWGNETKTNKTIIKNLIATADEETAELLMTARLGNGTPLGSHVGVLEWLAGIGRELNPAATVVPNSGSNASQAIDSEIAALEKEMGDKKSGYWKGSEAETKQARYRQLVGVREQIKST